MIQVIFRTWLIKLFVSINSTQAFYLLKVSWKIRSFLRFNPYQSLTLRNKFKKNNDLKKATTKNTISPKILKVTVILLRKLYGISSLNV